MFTDSRCLKNSRLSEKMVKNNRKNGAKFGATAIIWSLATGIMAICIPLVKISQSGIILPVTVMVGVSISTVAIWLSSNEATDD